MGANLGALTGLRRTTTAIAREVINDTAAGWCNRCGHFSEVVTGQLGTSPARSTGEGAGLAAPAPTVVGGRWTVAARPTALMSVAPPRADRRRDRPVHWAMMRSCAPLWCTRHPAAVFRCNPPVRRCCSGRSRVSAKPASGHAAKLHKIALHHLDAQCAAATRPDRPRHGGRRHRRFPRQ